MREQPPAHELSLHKLNQIERQSIISKAVPSQVIYSSEHVAWKDILINQYDHRPHAQIHIPAIAENAIALNLCGSTSLSGKVVRRFHAEHWQQGNMVIFPRGEPADLEWSASNEVLVLIPAPRLLTSLAAEINDTDSSRVEIIERINSHDPLLYQLGLALLAELRAHAPAGDLYADSLSRTLVLHLLRYHAVWPIGVPAYRGALSPMRLRRLVDYIHEHLADHLTLERIAQEAQLSPYYFARLFKQSMGQSLHQYVLEQRLNLAHQLLRSGRLSIGEVAIRAGFNDQSHLYRYFKRHYGITPGHLFAQRKNIQNNRLNIQDPDN